MSISFVYLHRVKHEINMENQEKMNVWAAISGQGPWDQQPQEYLGYITWREAVEWAKRQPKIVRLSLTSGYHNQGHYIR